MPWPSQARSVVDSPYPAAQYRYAPMQRADWFDTSWRRYSSLPTVTLDADRLISTVAPASAASEEGGTGVHKSSQISTKNVSSRCSSTWNSRRVPNGTSRWPHRSIVSRVA